jgi:phosphoglycerate dehydrogenase-like enzyme
MKEMYITEPNAIDIKAVKQLLPHGKFTLTLGNATFNHGFTSDAEALLIRSATTITSKIAVHFPRLRAIIRVGTGLDNIDTDFCKLANIKVFNAPGANANAVTEYVIAMILYVKRHLYLLNQKEVKAWNRFVFTGQGISEQIVGIIGFGNIGKLLHQKLVGLGCKKLLIYDPYISAEVIAEAGGTAGDLDTVFSRADVISLHLPLVPETRHIINAEKLQLLKPGALLINAARGGIVDESAVLSLPADKIYVADTVEGEPKVNLDLLEKRNIIITPHIASLTSSSEKAMLEAAIKNWLQS